MKNYEFEKHPIDTSSAVILATIPEMHSTEDKLTSLGEYL